jgi:energy-coupling factor transporter ATP-binding protein EcfA2/energy-coupling factor transporter transmembrane protein EcfT
MQSDPHSLADGCQLTDPDSVPFAVRAERFTYRYPSLESTDPAGPALEDLSFVIPAGQLVGLVGASGSGLTTLCRALAGIVPHETGGVVRGWLEVAGSETTSVSPAELAERVGIVFEDPEANLIGLSVAEEVAFALELRGDPPEEVARRVDWALAVVGLAALRDRPVNQLSGGQKQRLAIAVALARQPALLVLDQPAAQLDPLGKQEIQRALAELAAQPEYRLTIVLAERDADFLLPLVERLLGLASGRLALDAPANVAFADPDRLGEFGIDPPQLALLAVALAPVLGSTPLPVFRTVEDARTFLARVVPASSPHHELLTQATRDATRLTARSAAEPSRAALDASAEPVLQLERVSFRYTDGPLVLQDIDLTVAPGEIVALVGPNGSGKTTLARHVIGALRPERGRVLVAGQETRTLSIGELARFVGYVAQNPDHQLVRTTPRDEVAFTLRTLGSAPEAVAARTAAVLEQCGLALVADRPHWILSRSQRQLAALAAALARQPRLLVLDEPTSALDRAGRDRLARLLAERAANGQSTLVVSHDLRFVARCAHRVVLLSGGRVWASGTPRAVLGDAELLARAGLVPLPVTALAHVLGLPPALEPAELVAALEHAGNHAPARTAQGSVETPAVGTEGPMTEANPARATGASPFLTRIDPRVKLALALGLALPVLLWQSPLLLLAMTGFLHLVLWRAGGFDRARSLAVWRALAPLLVLVLLLRPLFDRSGAPILLEVGPLVITLPGLLGAVGAALRVVALALLALAWFATTNERAFVQSLVRLGLPLSVGLALAIGLRFIPVFAQTFWTAAEALQTRGWIIPERGMARLRALLPVLSVALAATLRQAQQLSWALAARGVGRRGNRPHFADLRMRALDWSVLVTGAALAAALLVAALAGVGRSPLWPLA